MNESDPKQETETGFKEFAQILGIKALARILKIVSKKTDFVDEPHRKSPRSAWLDV